MGFSSSFSPPAAVAACCRCLSAGLLLLRAWRQAFASASVALVQGIQSSAKSGEFSKPGEFTNSPESGEFRSLVRKSLGYRGIGLILPGWAFSAQSLPAGRPSSQTSVLQAGFSMLAEPCFCWRGFTIFICLASAEAHFHYLLAFHIILFYSCGPAGVILSHISRQPNLIHARIKLENDGWGDFIKIWGNANCRALKISSSRHLHIPNIFNNQKDILVFPRDLPDTCEYHLHSEDLG